MKRERKGRGRDRGPRVVTHATECGVRVKQRFKGSQVIIEVMDSRPEHKDEVLATHTRHVKDGWILLYSETREEQVLTHDEEGTPIAATDGKGRPKYETVRHEYKWEVPVD